MKDVLKTIALLFFLIVGLSACQKEIVPALDDLQGIEAEDRAGADDVEVDGDDDSDGSIDGDDTDGDDDGDDGINDGDEDDEDDEGSAHKEAQN